jgi:sugar phosphate isomerase/epimerase
VSIFRVGLNPYGLTYTLGLQGLGTSRSNPAPLGLPGFVRIARDIGARTLELDLRWLTGMNSDELARIADDADAAGMVIVCSTWLRHDPDETLDDARRIARMLRASLIRMHLAPVLEGARAAQGDHWPGIVAHARAVLTREAARARDQGLRIGIENHQDFGSEELLAFAGEAGDNVGIVLDTGNAFAVGEDPVAFTERVAHRLVHVHLKDYRAQFTDEGFRLVRCALGEGCVPFELMARTIARLTPDLPVTASIELAALEARHIRLFAAEWWHGYPGRDASELAIAIGRLRRRRLDRYDDYRTPWEQEAGPDELVASERANLDGSVRYLQQLGWM